MALTLSKGGNLSLTKTDPTLEQVLVGLGGIPAQLMEQILIWMLLHS